MPEQRFTVTVEFVIDSPKQYTPTDALDIISDYMVNDDDGIGIVSFFRREAYVGPYNKPTCKVCGVGLAGGLHHVWCKYE